MTSGSGSRRGGGPSTPDPASERVAVGRIAAAHGIRGELVLQPLSDVPGRFAAGVRLLLSLPGAPARLVTITAVRPHREVLLIRLEGVEDRTDAEALRGALLEVEERDVPPAPEGGWYHFQLIGCRCVDAKLGDLGEVAEVLEGGGGELLRVVGPRGELLLPFVDSFLGEVNVDERRIDWHLPDGFVDPAGRES
jgi:16S rRNA processing protein RimM